MKDPETWTEEEFLQHTMKAFMYAVLNLARARGTTVERCLEEMGQDLVRSDQDEVAYVYALVLHILRENARNN